MNWFEKPVVLFLVTINFLFIQSANCQNLNEIVNLSDQQFANGNFDLAANEYNRALFFGYHAQDQLCLKIANCYFNQNKLEQSAKFFDRAYFSTQSDSIKTEAVLGKSFSLILDKRYMLALSELMNIDSAKITSHDIKLNFLKGITYFGLHQDKLSEEAFNKCMKGISNKTDLSDIEKEFVDLKKAEKRFNPQTAWMLSLFLPGSGQLYSGEYKEAANSAVLLGGLIYLTISFAGKYSFIEAIVTVLPWFQRYYIGGANKAERLALEKQLTKRNDSYQSILKHIETEYQGNPANSN